MNANYKSIILAISLFFALSTSTSAAPGDLDLTFGSGGIVFTRPGTLGLFDYALGMAIQADGRIVVVGEGSRGLFNSAFAIVRYNPDGSLDSSLGGSGIVITQLTGDYDRASSVAIQADGKIVVAGSRYDGAGGSSFAVVRYDPNGSLDTSFNGTGIVITSVGSSRDYAQSVAIQADGKIVVAGGSGFNDLALVRYNPNGSLDTTFNGTGKVITPVGGGASSVAIQADGKIVAAGRDALVRYHTDGTLDTSFDGTGIVSAVGGYSVAIQSDGKIVAAGGGSDGTNLGFGVVRLNPNGSLDTSFGGTGKIIIPMGIPWGLARSVAIQSNGKIVAVGSITNIRNDFAVARLNPNGTLDNTFNGTGKVISAITGANDYANAVAIQADGKIVVAGMSDEFHSDFYDFVVVRYQGDAPPAACPNPIDCTDFFVRQHYLDFLGREPDPLGAQWVDLISTCPPGETSCDRIHVSEAFFKSPEFQERGYFAFRFYSVSFGRKPDFAEFMPDLARVSGFLTPSELEAAKVSFINDFMARPAFVSRYNGLNNTQYVDALLSTAGVTLSNPPALIDALNSGSQTRGQVLRQIVESTEVFNKHFNQAFVVMQYFGYLRRDPDILYLNWIATLDANPSDSRHMIAGFLNSIEYRARFGPP